MSKKMHFCQKAPGVDGLKVSKMFENQMHIFNNIFPTFFDLSSNVLGSMFGKSFIATGNINSINGISKNTRNGTKRNISETVRRN